MAEQTNTCVKISTSEEVVILMHHTHTWLLPTANAVVIQALFFWLSALLFASAHRRYCSPT